MKKSKIFIACDTTNLLKVRKIINQSQSTKLKIGYKFGLEFMNSKNGRQFVSKLKDKIIFVDLKLNDTVNTMLSAVKALKDLKINYLTVHISSGLAAFPIHSACPPDAPRTEATDKGLPASVRFEASHVEFVGSAERTRRGEPHLPIPVPLPRTARRWARSGRTRRTRPSSPKRSNPCSMMWWPRSSRTRSTTSRRSRRGSTAYATKACRSSRR